MHPDNIYLLIYSTLREEFGHLGWWPAQTPFEIVAGAVLTQNTSWKNVEKAVGNLRNAGRLTPARMDAAEEVELQQLIRPAGYYRQKSRRLKTIASWIMETCGDDVHLRALADTGAHTLREDLLQIKGIGPETADSIILYALNKPVFVVDAYTARILGRHGLIAPESGYGEIQAELESGLPRDAELFGDFHAQLVELGKRFCKKTAPKCSECPLKPLLGKGEVEPF